MAANSKCEATKRNSFRYKLWRLVKRSASFCTKSCRSRKTAILNTRDMTYEKYSPYTKKIEVITRRNNNNFERQSTQIIKKKLKEKTLSLSKNSLESTEVLVNELPILIDELSVRIDAMKAELESIENKINKKKKLHEKRSRYSVVEIQEVHCNLCNAFFSEPVALNCGHIFCEWCISEHVLLTRSKKCPDCKENIIEMDTSKMMKELVASALAGASEQTKQEYKVMEYLRAFLREQRQIRFCAKLTKKTNGYKSDWF